MTGKQNMYNIREEIKTGRKSGSTTPTSLFTHTTMKIQRNGTQWENNRKLGTYTRGRIQR
jgi:hypothetical protein